jgi:sirohydrochlorin cobaltochelatase
MSFFFEGRPAPHRKSKTGVEIMRKFFSGLCVMAVFLGLTTTGAAMDAKKNKKAIVLANFGTTYPSALKAIITIRDKVVKAFPEAKVKVAFTSNIIRKIWRKRRTDKEFLKKHGAEFKEFLTVKGPLATIADLQDEGYRVIIVQPTHIYAGEEFADLTAYVEGLNSIKTIKPKYSPFVKLALGRPALGAPGILHDYHEDMTVAAKTLKPDVDLARENGAALVYMGHGNEYYSTGIYAEFQQVMRKMYPGVKIVIGTVEGYPSLSDVVSELKKIKPAKVVLKPMMVVAGDHANNDMAGDDDDSWRKIIEKLGVKVIPILRGLGENEKWAEIYVKHIKDAAKDGKTAF